MARDEPPPPLICILAGQSDMVGRGEPETLDDGLVDSIANNERGHRIRLLYEIDRLGKEGAPSDSGGRFRPLDRAAQYSRAGRRRSFGPEWGLAEALLRSDPFREGGRRDVYFIKFAAGSTDLHEDWAPGGELFAGMAALVREGARQIAAERTAEAAAADDPEVPVEPERERRRLLRDHAAFFWLQGHSDAGGNAATRNGYGENFLRFVMAVRKELLGEGRVDPDETSGRSGRPTGLNLPFVASELNWPLDAASKSSRRYARRLGGINDALRGACAALSASGESPCAFAEFPEDDDGFALSHRPDGHCDNEGLLSLGRNMARCFCAEFLANAN